MVMNKSPPLRPVHYSFPKQTTNGQNLARVRRQPCLPLCQLLDLWLAVPSLGKRVDEALSLFMWGVAVRVAGPHPALIGSGRFSAFPLETPNR